MEDDTESPVFRANKRRKVFRKRAESDPPDDKPNVTTDQVALIDGNASTPIGERDGTPHSDITRVRKSKKHGIAFSSSDRASSRPQNDNEETTMVISERHPAEQQNGRFTRQTGKAIVADDKHMSAYIDSKLAEMRSATTIPKPSTQENKTIADMQSQSKTHLPSASTHHESTPLSPSNPAYPTSPPQPPTTIQNPPTQLKPRRTRPPRPPSPSTLARSSLIDQILLESSHTPHYTAPNPTATTTENDHDPEAAAAAAFKADFLAQAEARNLSRRHPAVNASASAGSAAAGAAASGPKLGGSRAARERMRAAEEARGRK